MDNPNEYKTEATDNKVVITIGRTYNGWMQRTLRQTGKMNEVKKGEVIEKLTCEFPNGLQADIKIVSSDHDVTPWTEGVLFKDGNEICCTGVSDDILGEYIFHVGNDDYTVIVQVEDLEDTFKNLSFDMSEFFQQYMTTHECQCDEGVPDKCPHCQARDIYAAYRDFTSKLTTHYWAAEKVRAELSSIISEQEEKQGNADESLCETHEVAAELVGAIEEIATEYKA